MKKLLLISLLTFTVVMTGCGKGDNGANGIDGVTTTVNAPSPTTSVVTLTAEELDIQNIEQIISEENSYRYETLQSQYTKGLSCRVYKYQFDGNIAIAGSGSNGLGTLSQKIAYVYTGYFYHGTNNQSDGLNFLPEAYRSNPLYQSEVYVDCQGVLVVTETKLHKFGSDSDDNLIVTVNGTKVINRDDNHGVQSDASMLTLQKDRVYSIRIQYRQYNGASVLRLYQNNNHLLPKNLYH